MQADTKEDKIVKADRLFHLFKPNGFRIINTHTRMRGSCSYGCPSLQVWKITM